MDNTARRKAENFLGVVTAGSLAKGVTTRIRSSAPLEHIQTGQFVVIQSSGMRFFGLLTDVTLGATSNSILLDPPFDELGTASLLNEVLRGVYTYGDAHIQLSLALPDGQTEPKPVRSMPQHFNTVYIAEENDFEQVFGEEDIDQPQGKNFAIGKPLDMEIDICLNLKTFAERSNGIFGKSGTGKSVLTRLILSGLIRGDICSNLIFDMHDEYGSSQKGEGNQRLKGLRDLFPSRTMVYAVRDHNQSERPTARATAPDGEIVIGLNQIEVDDIILLQRELNLTALAADSAHFLESEYKDKWIAKLLSMNSEDVKEFCDRTNASAQSIVALQRRLRNLERLPFISPNQDSINVINDIVDYLLGGRNVIIQYGRASDLLSYMMIANILTRRIHRKYQEKMENFQRTQKPEDEPRRLMITIEEAHKFLTPEIADQTIFGTIAREMRKYNVTLLVVDQRPSSIDREIMSQIGTRITALLNDDQDIEAVFTGVSNPAGYKTVLASLDSRQQALVFGHAAPMPVVIRTRNYDQDFYSAITHGMPGVVPVKVPRAISQPVSNGTNGHYANSNVSNGSPDNGTAPNALSWDEWEAEMEVQAKARLKKDEADLFDN